MFKLLVLIRLKCRTEHNLRRFTQKWAKKGIVKNITILNTKFVLEDLGPKIYFGSLKRLPYLLRHYYTFINGLIKSTDKQLQTNYVDDCLFLLGFVLHMRRVIVDCSPLFRRMSLLYIYLSSRVERAVCCCS